MYNVLLLALVNESYKWSNEVISKIQNCGIMLLEKSIPKIIFLKIKDKFIR